MARLTLLFWPLKKLLTPLKRKLFSYGIGGKILEWIKCFFVLQEAKGSS